jgi:hypothetical protein
VIGTNAFLIGLNGRTTSSSSSFNSTAKDMFRCIIDKEVFFIMFSRIETTRQFKTRHLLIHLFHCRLFYGSSSHDRLAED